MIKKNTEGYFCCGCCRHPRLIRNIKKKNKYHYTYHYSVNCDYIMAGEFWDKGYIASNHSDVT